MNKSVKKQIEDLLPGQSTQFPIERITYIQVLVSRMNRISRIKKWYTSIKNSSDFITETRLKD